MPTCLTKPVVIRWFSFLACGHCLGSLKLWSLMYVMACQNELVHPGTIQWDEFIPALVPVFLFIAFFYCGLAVKKSQRVLLVVLILALILAIGDFSYEVLNDRPQIRMCFVGSSIYFNWWWYSG